MRHEAQSAAPNKAATAYKIAPVAGILPLLSGREDVAGMRHIGGVRDPAVAYDLVRP